MTISLYKQMTIKEMYEKDGLSINAIAKKLDICWRTAKKYVDKEDFSNQIPTLRKPHYRVLGPYLQFIDDILEDDQTKRRKSRHTSVRIYERLQDEKGFTGSYSAVNRYVQKKKGLLGTPQEPENKKQTIPMKHFEGKAQCDFGDFIYHTPEGEERTGYFLGLSFPYSNMYYVVVFPAQNMECLFTGLILIFDHLGGVPPVIRFDNMSTAVAKIKANGEREETPDFINFRMHYNFEAEFCNPDSPQEKGNIESKMKYFRSHFMVPEPTISSFEEFNKPIFLKIEEWAKKTIHYKTENTTVWELFQEDRKRLLELPSVKYIPRKFKSAVVNNCGEVRFENNIYGLSPTLSGKTIMIETGWNTLKFLLPKEGKKGETVYEEIKTYPRNYGKKKEVLDWNQMIGFLPEKMNGFYEWNNYDGLPPKWKALFDKVQEAQKGAGPDQEKWKSFPLQEAVKVLAEISQNGHGDLADQVLEVAEGTQDYRPSSLRAYYYSLINPSSDQAALTASQQKSIDKGHFDYDPDLGVYDELWKKGKK